MRQDKEVGLYTETKQRSCKPACLQYKKRASTPRMAPASLPPDPAEPSAPIGCCLRDLPLPLQSIVASFLRPLPLVRLSGLARWCVPFSAYATGELQLEPEALRPECGGALESCYAQHAASLSRLLGRMPQLTVLSTRSAAQKARPVLHQHLLEITGRALHLLPRPTVLVDLPLFSSYTWNPKQISPCYLAMAIAQGKLPRLREIWNFLLEEPNGYLVASAVILGHLPGLTTLRLTPAHHPSDRSCP